MKWKSGLLVKDCSWFRFGVGDRASVEEDMAERELPTVE